MVHVGHDFISKYLRLVYTTIITRRKMYLLEHSSAFLMNPESLNKTINYK